ncbi:hypothetical protein Pst134EA_013799 [Puccinia striiformis f. sp. tritici]|uniref:Uncharacterized protein n=1 Tax=Puccinia striiformis f. sp. tritici PST-78 TaxID=1165861 RepID=A0A0L0VBX8_9BASI|nr:hypothetical protein Pst134EA_013799 [Puccinia striiformis f. sp. tritici]KAH9454699.1 hypothetical protein Pst134EB_014763 [Puccinia striiformis f. sp. tritici]KAH9465944.1 hypothetical protein Pst134EA_013799 [Puccinia striiformis f. sp. tritici]KAI9612860.1 hypothetical protein KEM48_003935 [Puccinia striiformis f. sp. tritici PST-130]KNE96454.1 hypothetical protein PSTG_10286 [Puccinia striiformis f. sp. tritici PST-78]
MSLDDAFWNDGLFYHSDAPWAIDANVRQGFTCILVLSQIQEEFELIAQELVRAMSWAISYHDQLTQSIAYLRERVSLMKRGVDEVPRDHFGEINLFNVSRRDKAKLIRMELEDRLSSHNEIIQGWSDDFLWLWGHCQPLANPDFLATWRDAIKNLPPDKYSISGDPVNDNDDNWEDEILVAVAEDGEDADVVASNVEDEGHD